MRGNWLSIVLVMASASAFAAETAKQTADLQMRLVMDGWGGSDETSVRKVLQSASHELLRHCPKVELPGIQVSPSGGPIVLHRRLPDNFVDMKLATGDRRWSQCAFQFGHELCHVLCRYDSDPNSNQWFEESLCETASLFVLRRMSESWQLNPPSPNWKPYAPALNDYADERIAKAQLPTGQTLATWYQTHANHLASNPIDRDKNLVIATALLPLFEAEPEHWAALYWINSATPPAAEPFVRYLQAWHEHVPEAHRAFVEKIAARFDIRLPPGHSTES